MSAVPSPVPRTPAIPVRSVGVNAWLITGTPERPDIRARHGRARWCLCAGLRRRPLAMGPVRA
jgi:hypothetical protein